MKAQEYLDLHYFNNERESIKELNISNKKLEGGLDLSGFVSLERLDCNFNKINELNISNCFNLISLLASENKIFELDLSNNKQLKNLNISTNQLTKLRLDNNLLLESLDCCDNRLLDLDVRRNEMLVRLNCASNGDRFGRRLTNLSIGEGNKLKEVVIWGNNVTADLKIFSHLTELTELVINSKNAPSMNDFCGSLEALKNCKKLRTLRICFCENIAGGLEYLSTGELTEFDYQGTIFQRWLSPLHGDITIWKKINNLENELKIERQHAGDLDKWYQERLKEAEEAKELVKKENERLKKQIQVLEAKMISVTNGEVIPKIFK